MKSFFAGVFAGVVCFIWLVGVLGAVSALQLLRKKPDDKEKK